MRCPTRWALLIVSSCSRSSWCTIGHGALRSEARRRAISCKFGGAIAIPRQPALLKHGPLGRTLPSRAVFHPAGQQHHNSISHSCYRFAGRQGYAKLRGSTRHKRQQTPKGKLVKNARGSPVPSGVKVKTRRPVRGTEQCERGGPTDQCNTRLARASERP